jgi:hypothetical protein
MCFVYLIQEHKLLGTNRFKVGFSSKCHLNRLRLKAYGKKRREIKIFTSNDSFLIECEIKKEFNNIFKLVAGTETFEGEENKMICEFVKICQRYNSSEYMNPIKENIAKIPIIKLYTLENVNYQLTYYDRSDVLTNYNIGLDKNNSEEEMIKQAIKNKNFIITKSGKDAQWYLKGNEDNIKNILYFKNRLVNDGTKRNGLYSILIEKIINGDNAQN